MKSKRFWAGVFAAAVVFALGAPARASIVSVFSVNPNSIVAGETAELDLTLNLFADAGFKNATFTGGIVTFGSDDGALEFFAITPGTTTQTFSFDFTYPETGAFHPFYVFAASYSEEFSFGHRTFTISTGRIGLGTTTLEVGSAPEAPPIAPAVPEASTWIMLLLGFAGLGFLGHRRRSKPVFRFA